jgi:Flp pilus assembly protein TadD
MIILVTSCATNRHHREVDSAVGAGLNSETIARTPLSNIHEKDEKNPFYLCHKGQIKLGLSLLKKVSDKRSKEASYWNQVGACYYMAQSYDKALFYYKIALSLDAKNYSIFNNLALIYVKKNYYKRAIEYFNNSLKLKPGSVVVRYNLSSLHFNFSNFSRSIEVIQSIYAQNTSDPDINLLLVKNYIHLKQYQKAQAYLAKMPQDFLNDHEVSNYYAFNMLRLKKYSEAKSILSKNGFPARQVQKKFKQRLLTLIDQKELNDQPKMGKGK